MGASFTYAIIATEFFSIVACCVLFFASWTKPKEQTSRTKLFLALIVMCILGLACDAASWIIDGVESLSMVQFWLSLFSAEFSFVLIALFSLYLYFFLKERSKISMGAFYACEAYCLAAVIFTLVAVFTGRLFTITNGSYITGPLYSAYLVVNFIPLVVGLAIVTFYHKKLGWRNCIVFYLYILLPAISAFINIFIPEWEFSYPASVISLLIMYVMIQSERTEQLETDSRETMRIAMHDSLTGLLNRHAYSETLEKLRKSEGSVGIFFSDLNGLKRTNDTDGHAAGDELLKQYAAMLISLFRKDEVYRISGDEFLAVMPDMPKGTFDRRAEKLEGALTVDGQLIACYGVAFGNSSDVDALINLAESHMYKQKSDYYETHPELRR